MNLLITDYYSHIGRIRKRLTSRLLFEYKMQFTVNFMLTININLRRRVLNIILLFSELFKRSLCFQVVSFKCFSHRISFEGYCSMLTWKQRDFIFFLILPQDFELLLQKESSFEQVYSIYLFIYLLTFSCIIVASFIWKFKQYFLGNLQRRRGSQFIILVTFPEWKLAFFFFIIDI